MERKQEQNAHLLAVGTRTQTRNVAFHGNYCMQCM